MNTEEIDQILNSDLPDDEILYNIASKLDAQTPQENIKICPMCSHKMKRFICPNCEYMDDTFSDCPLFDEKPYRTSMYKRKIHFNELLNTITANEQFTPTPQLLKAIKRHVKKDITPANISIALYRLGLNKFYKHQYTIYRALTNKTIISIPTRIMEKMKDMFMTVEIEYRRHNIKKPFFNYMFLIHKFNDILQSNIQNLPPIRGKQKKINDENLLNEIIPDKSIFY